MASSTKLHASSPALAASPAAITNDENTCPNNQQSSQPMGSKVAKLTALFDKNATTTNNNSCSLNLTKKLSSSRQQLRPSLYHSSTTRRISSSNSIGSIGLSSSTNNNAPAVPQQQQHQNVMEKKKSMVNNINNNTRDDVAYSDNDKEEQRHQRRLLLLRQRQSQKQGLLLEHQQQQSWCASSSSLFSMNSIRESSSSSDHGDGDDNVGTANGADPIKSRRASNNDISSKEEEALICINERKLLDTEERRHVDTASTSTTNMATPDASKNAKTRGTVSSGDLTLTTNAFVTTTKQGISTTHRPRAALALFSHLVLLVLALFEVQHYYFFSPTAMVFDVISEMTGWSDIFHLGFVVAFGVRALAATWCSTRRFSKTGTKKGRTTALLHYLQMLLFFVFILPIFKDCGSEAANNNDLASKFCLFVEISIERNKGKATAAKHILTISNPRYSVFDLVAREWYKRTKFVIKSKIKGRVMKEVQRALWSPFAFRGRLKKLFTILRWAKFVAPLVGTCNKFRGHILDMIKKRRQHIKSKAAQKRWNDLLDALSKRSKLERSVLKMQKRFRERRESKAKRRFALMSPQRPRATSNSRMAHQIRQRLAEEQQLSRSKLETMEVLDRERKLRRQVSHDERRNITKHKESERKLKKRLLLSPKTSFAVGWKYFTVACVALEISQIVFAPMLSGELKKMSLDKFLLSILKASSSRCDHDKKMAEAPSIFIPVINNLGDITCTSSSLKQTWLVTAHIIATVLVPIVNTIFFLDVFITFFTGELTSSGTLTPKPFFKRYILPGIGLQLIVNPAMIEISRLVKHAIVHAMHIGPSLCFHLLLAGIPFAAYCYDLLLDIIFDFVERQNKTLRSDELKYVQKK